MSWLGILVYLIKEYIMITIDGYSIGSYPFDYKDVNIVSLFVSDGVEIKCFSGKEGLVSLSKQLVDKKPFSEIVPNTRFYNKDLDKNTYKVNSKDVFDAVSNKDFSKIGVSVASMASANMNELLLRLELLSLAK